MSADARIATDLSPINEFRLRQALSIIHARFREETLTVEIISRDLGFSSSLLRQLFHRYLETTPVKYICHIRLKQALTLMRVNPGQEIKQIMMQSGFSDLTWSGYFRHKGRNQLTLCHKLNIQ